MTAPERTFVTWPNENSAGLAFSKSANNRTEYIRADLATLQLPRGAVMDGFKIKTLVWEEQDGKSYRQANCALGQYQVSWLVEFECWQLSRPPKAGQAWKDGFSRHSSKDAAKAAAQADFESRILAALEPQPAYVTLQRIGTGIYEVEPQPDPRDEVIKGLADALCEAMIVPEAWYISGFPNISVDAIDQTKRAVPLARAALAAAKAVQK